MAVPIWKDYYFTINKTSAEFRLRLNNSSGAIIYTGKAVARPNESSIKIRVNDICADYIKRTLPVWGQEFSPQAFTTTFLLQYLNGAVWTSAGSVEFLDDWSYDYHYLASRDGFSFPINPLVEGRQYLVISLSTSANSVNATIRFKNGGSATQVVTIRRTADFNNDFNSDFALFEMIATGNSTGTAVIDLSNFSNVASVTISGRTFPVDSSSCHNYALYYVNAYGGWDSLLLTGRVSEQDNYTRHNQSVEYDNTTIEGRGTKNFTNEIDKTFTLQTGWIDELGASRMHHLLGSILVYLHDLNTGDIMPVVLTNADCPFKTYGGEGNRLINYTIEATLAQVRIRRF